MTGWQLFYLTHLINLSTLADHEKTFVDNLLLYPVTREMSQLEQEQLFALWADYGKAT